MHLFSTCHVFLLVAHEQSLAAVAEGRDQQDRPDRGPLPPRQGLHEAAPLCQQRQRHLRAGVHRQQDEAARGVLNELFDLQYFKCRL